MLKRSTFGKVGLGTIPVLAYYLWVDNSAVPPVGLLVASLVALGCVIGIFIQDVRVRLRQMH